MKFNRKEHSRFVQWLDRTAEKNPVLWLPCVVLLVIALGAEDICNIVSTAFPCREKICVSDGKIDVQLARKPFALRVVAMTLVLSFVFMTVPEFGQFVSADEYYSEPMTDWQNDINVTGNNSYGNMLADEFSEKNSEQQENNGYNVFSVEMQGNTAVVDYEAVNSSTLVVGIYDESGSQLLTTGSIEVTADEDRAIVDLDSTKIPQYYYIKAYLINTETMRPLCTVYECPTYTQEMQEFLSKTVNDFDPDRVLNLDSDMTNNFAVLSDDAVITEESADKNNVVSVDNNNNIYVIENADDIVKGLQNGDVFSHEYGNNEVLIVKVNTVSIVGDTVTIYGDDSSLEDVFEYVKIDSTFDSSDVIADTSTLEDGVEYNYTGGIAAYAVNVGGGVSYDHNFKFTDKDIENYKDGTTSAKVNLNGSLDLHLGGRAKLYISWSQTYVELVLDYSVKMQLTFSESLHGKIPLVHFEVSPCAGVYIKFDPSIVVELDGKIELKGELSGSYGFKADKNGAHNISQTPRFTKELSAVGTFYIGVSLEPKVTIISEKLVNAYINGRMGVEVKASLKYGETDEKNGIRHDCKSCIDGDISIKYNLSAGIKLLNDKLNFNIDLINKQIKISDYYRSDDFGDSGFTKCPHYSYKVSAHIHGEKSLLPGKTKIECNNGSVYTTDVEGRVDFYLPNGEYWFKISNDKYSASEYAKIQDKPTTISAWLNSTFAHGSYGSGDIPIDPNPINPDPIDPDPVDPTPTESDFSYTILNGKVTITGYKGTDTEVVIPDTIEGLSVTSIGNRAFQYFRNLTSITIPNSVTSIGDGAFSDCTNLKSITIPNYVTEIKKYTFSHCKSLTGITIPSNVTSIGEEAFSSSGLTSVIIPQNVTSVGRNAFSFCYALEEVTVHDSIDYEVYVFDFCDNIRSVTLCGNNAFLPYVIPNYQITKVIISEGITSIDNDAFKGCKKLTEVIIPDSVTTIGSNAFRYCENLDSVILPNGLTSIENEAFSDCTSLTSIIIPDSVVSVGNFAFSKCIRLKSAAIPNNITFLGEGIFQSCTNLEDANIPNELDYIPKWLFAECSSLKYAIIPQNVTKIGDSAFFQCAKLENVIFPENVTSIGINAFSGCTGLTSITIPENVKEIGSGAFAYCSRATILTTHYDIDNYKYNIGIFSGCENLRTLICTGNSVGYIDAGFPNDQITDVIISEDATTIKSSAFNSYTNLNNIIIPSTVTKIEGWAFYKCTNLENITIPKSIKTIETHTFCDCSSLEQIIIPDSVTLIDAYAFGYCKSLKNITIPNSVTSIENGAFRGCSNLNNIILPENITLLDVEAFQGCMRLTKINIPNGVTSIGNNTFKDCINLKEITIPASVKYISYDVFDDCPNLTIYCNSGSYAENYAIQEKIPYVIIDDPTEHTVQFEYDETETTPVTDTEIDNDITDNTDNNNYPIENPEETSNNVTDLQEVITAVTETPEVYNSYDEPMYFTAARDISVSQTFTGLIPNEVYNCYGMKSRKADDPFNSSNLLFISQAVSDSSGTLNFSYLPDEEYSNSQIFVKAMTEFDIPNAQIIYAEENDGSVNIGWNPVNGASQYKVYKLINDVCTEYQTTALTSCTINNLPADTECGFIVQICVNGEWSVLAYKDVLYYNASSSEHQHKFGSEWKTDALNHWHECKCGEKSDVSAHAENSGTVTVKPTAEIEGTITYSCTVCGYVTRTEQIPPIGNDHIHNFGTELKSDSTSHWYECECGEKAAVAPHIEDNGRVTTAATADSEGVRTYSCKVCNAVIRTEAIPPITLGHSCNFDTDWSYNEWGHWQECDCGARENAGTHTDNGGITVLEPTETSTGISVHSCTVCGYVMRTESIPAHTEEHIHSFSTNWYYDDTFHWHECSCGEKSDLANHRENEGVVTLQPTTISTGIRTYSCRDCGYVMRTDTIPEVSEEHTHSFGTDWKYDSTSHWHECSCGERSDIAVHTENSGVVTVQPTTTSTGTRTYSCTVCGYVTRTETIPVISAPTIPIHPDPIIPDYPYPTPGTEILPPVLTVNKNIDISVTSDLKDLAKGEARIKTKRRFFDASAEVYLSNTDEAEAAGKRALERLDDNGLICYPFDVSVYNVENGGKMQLAAGGYITFEVAVPESMEANAASIEVYHIPGGVPEHIESEIITDKYDNLKIVFTASEFSPYMFTAVAGEDIASGAGVTAGSVSVDMTSPFTNGVNIPTAKLPRVLRYSGKKRRYRILRKRRLDDLVFVY